MHRIATFEIKDSVGISYGKVTLQNQGLDDDEADGFGHLN